MSNSPTHDDPLGDAGGGASTSDLFAGMVVQQTNLAMMLLGKVPNPETGKHIRELDGAKMFIDQLEMLAVKTKGNLEKQEEALLKQSLTMLRLAFVEAVNAPLEPTVPAAETPAGAAPPVSPAPSSPAREAEESRTKFSKKY